MAYKDKLYTGGLVWNSPFDFRSKYPIDNSIIKNNFKDIKSTEAWEYDTGKYALYIGKVVIDAATGDLYQFKPSSKTVSEETITTAASWVKVTTATDSVAATSWKGVVTSLPSSGLSHGDTYYLNDSNTPANNGYYTWNANLATPAFEKIVIPELNHALTADTATSAASAGKLAEEIKINGLEFDGHADVNDYVEATLTQNSTSKFVADLTKFGASGSGVVTGLEAGTKVRVHFASSYYGSNTPTLNECNLSRAGHLFTAWAGGIVIEMTFVPATNEDPAYFLVDTPNGADVILDNFSTANLQSFDFSMAEPAQADLASIYAKLTVLNEGSEKEKLHFLKYDGRRCKFDVVVNTSDRSLSFIYDKFLHEITITKKTENEVDTYTLSDVKTDLKAGGGSGMTAQERQTLNNLSTDVTNIKSNMLVYALDAQSTNA